MVEQQMKKNANGHSKKGSKMRMPPLPKGKAAVTTMTGVAGAVVGAGVAVAAATALSDKGTREKVKQTFNKVKTQVMDTIHEEQKKMNAAQASQKKLSNGQKQDRIAGEKGPKQQPEMVAPGQGI